ncbi:MAG: hypothetical protein KIH03_06940 [Paludibacteraceae bacterium]|nr:hypothetical protein [Paludibacteraceae bacterium]
MWKKILFFGLVAITAFNFMSCDDEDENNNSNTTNNGSGTTTSNLSAEFVGASDCLGNALGDGTRADGADDQIKIPFIAYKYDSAKGEVELNLENVIFNCAAKPKMDITFSGDTIIFNAYNSDTSGVMAKCICLFNLTSKVKGVESKVYYIRPINSTDVEDVQVLELSQKEEGVVYFQNFYGF